MAAWTLAGLLLLLPGLENDLERAVVRSGIARSGLSAAVGRAGEEPFYVLAPKTPRIPASNLKILTAAAALEILGAEYRFTTTIARDAEGRLVVVGGGDPNLSGRFFDGEPEAVLRALAQDVRRRGVTAVKGPLLLDASRFDDVWTHPDWPADQLDRWYCAPVAALVYNDSCWDVTVLPGPRPGAPARVEVRPALRKPPLLIDCPTTARGAAHVVHIGRAEQGEGLVVRGKILLSSAGVTGSVAVRDPVLFFGRAFHAALEAEGVAVPGGVARGRLPGAEPLVHYRSTLARSLKVMLERSQNLYAECIFKSLGRGSYESAAAAGRSALEARGIDVEGVRWSDGSGLARSNRVTAAALYGALQALRDRPVFVEALAAGGTGTLRRRYRNLGGRLRAKTGTIRGVSALSGYVTGREGGRYVFVLLANGRSTARARKLQDLIVRALAEAP